MRRPSTETVVVKVPPRVYAAGGGRAAAGPAGVGVEPLGRVVGEGRAPREWVGPSELPEELEARQQLRLADSSEPVSEHADGEPNGYL